MPQRSRCEDPSSRSSASSSECSSPPSAMIPRSTSTTAFTISPNCSDAIATSSERVSCSLTIRGGGISMQISGITRAEDSRSCNSLPEVERGGEAATGGLNPRHVFSFGVGNVSFYSMTSRLLMMLQVFVSPPQKLGAVPHGTRIIAPITSGTFEGARLRGKVLPGGGDWTLSRSDSVLELDL